MIHRFTQQTKRTSVNRSGKLFDTTAQTKWSLGENSGPGFDDVRIRFNSDKSGQLKKSGDMRNVQPVQMCPKPADAGLTYNEHELESFNSDSDSEDNYNVASVRREGDKISRHVSKDRIVNYAKSREQLVKDAGSVHAVLSGAKFSGNITVVCAVLQVREGFLHIAMVNNTLMRRKMREEAEGIGYTIIKGIKTHAEANMILYVHKHEKDARLIAFGCDKDTCPQCEELLAEFMPAGLEFPSRALNADGTKKYSYTYHFKSTLKNPKGIGPFVEWMRQIINVNYDADGKKKNKSPIVIMSVIIEDNKIRYVDIWKDNTTQKVRYEYVKKNYTKELLDFFESLIVLSDKK